MNLKKWMLLIVMVLLFGGCNQPAEGEITPAPIYTQYVEEDLFASTDSEEVITLPDNVTKTPEESGITKYSQPQENIEYVEYDAANYRKTLDLIKNFRSMFCIDSDTGVVYFVDQDKDGYIYCLMNGEAELVVELPARELHMQNGNLYFIWMNSDEYEYKELATGDVYAYIPAEGSVNKIFSPEELEGDIYRIFPYEDGIAFSMRVVKKEIEIDEKGRAYYPTRYDYYYYSFETALVEADTYKRAALGWRDYYLTTTENETGWHCELWSRENEEEGKLSLETGGNGFVVEDTFYSYEAGKLWIYNLLNGDKKFFDVTEIFNKLLPGHINGLNEDGIAEEDYAVPIYAITANKDGVWMMVQLNYLLHIDPESEKMDCYWVDKEPYYINELYTDGISLYGIYGALEDNYNGKLVRICTEKIIGQDPFSEVPMIGVEYLIE